MVVLSAIVDGLLSKVKFLVSASLSMECRTKGANDKGPRCFNTKLRILMVNLEMWEETRQLKATYPLSPPALH